MKLKSIVWIILLKNATLAINKGSSEIWSDKLSLLHIKGSSAIWSDKASLLHIKGTQRGGEHGGESRQSHGGAEGTKSDRAVVYVLLIALVINE